MTIQQTSVLPLLPGTVSLSSKASISRDQKHFLWTMDGPDSSYSLFAIHICWKVERDAKMDPPIQTEYLRSGGATTLTCEVMHKNCLIKIEKAQAMQAAKQTNRHQQDHWNGLPQALRTIQEHFG